jgi:short-subunit dehydrogenase involved in D-alanine esterification of teichoic acids
MAGSGFCVSQKRRFSPEHIFSFQVRWLHLFPKSRRPNMDRNELSKGLAVITGASTGIGYELAKCAAREGYDLIIAADQTRIQQAAASLKEFGTSVQAIETDLSTEDGVDRLMEAIEASGRSVDLLMANAGRGRGKGFLDQDLWRLGKSSIRISSAPSISSDRSAT